MDRGEVIKLLRAGPKRVFEWYLRHVPCELIPNLSGARLERANLSGASLSGANLSEADLNWANLSKANLTGANLSRAELFEAKLSGAKLDGAKLTGANLSRADLTGADLSCAADLSNADLSNADLRSANLREAHLIEADLSCANLIEANLYGASLIAARLCCAKLGGANLTLANLERTDLSGANLAGTYLSRAILSGADFDRALCASTAFDQVDLSTVKGLESVHHLAPCTIGIDTLFQSRGRIPEVFLRGCGVPDTLIRYLPSLIGSMDPIHFYSCFISYSSKNRDFAERLHTDLQAKGVRTWFDQEHLKTGDKMRPGINAAIRVHDKLMLVLTEHSIASDWVEGEVEAALERERREKRIVLFPIKLDDSVMETPIAWASHIRQTRQIGDFRSWENHSAYQTAFTRLLNDLKAEDSTGAKAT